MTIREQRARDIALQVLRAELPGVQVLDVNVIVVERMNGPSFEFRVTFGPGTGINAGVDMDYLSRRISDALNVAPIDWLGPEPEPLDPEKSLNDQRAARGLSVIDRPFLEQLGLSDEQKAAIIAAYSMPIGELPTKLDQAMTAMASQD